MSDEQDKIKHSKRKQQKENHINRQMALRKAHAVDLGGLGVVVGDSNNPHRYHKVSGMTCGNSNCFACGNPRKFFDERTVQEQRAMQDIDNRRDKHSNGLPPENDQ